MPGFGKPDGTALHWLEVNAARLPPLRFDCGTDDHLLAGNRALHAALDARAIEHQYEEFAGGHDWPYWRLHLADTLRFLDSPRRALGRRPVGRPGARLSQGDELAPHGAVVDVQAANADGQAETPRAGAAGVEEQDAAPLFLSRLVRVAGDHGTEAARRGIEIQLIEIVQHVDGEALRLEHRRPRDRRRPEAPLYCSRGPP